MKTPAMFNLFALAVLALSIGGLPVPTQAEAFGGFGLVVAQIYDADATDNRGAIVVLDVLQDGEAQQAGLHRVDIILSVDGKHTAGREFGDVIINSLRGEVGSTAKLKIKRTSEGKTLEVPVKRALITPPPAPAQ